MAKLYPEYLPEYIISDPGRQAECKVYSVLKTLSDKYTVFYSIHWESIEQSGAQEGEADFIIVHPDMGMVILEVKGGAIRYDGETNEWFSQSMAGNVYKITDPVAQGYRNRYHLEEEFRRLPGWPEGEFNIENAVCFPDTFVDGLYMRPDLLRELIIDRKDMDDIRASVLRVYQKSFGRHLTTRDFGQKRMQMVIHYLAQSFELRTPLGVEIEYEDQKLIQLTEQQFMALSLLGDRRRVAIGGCAGSGKTMLAVEKARQFSELNMNVLLICFNAPLAEYLRRRLPKVDIYHFHELCRQAAKQIDLSLPRNIDEQEYFENALPEALLKAANTMGRIYDAIIIDEGQDFKENYWIALESLLKENGYLYIFYDNNQNLYNGTLDFGGLIQEQPFQLTQNCRNTLFIHNIVVKYHSNPNSIKSSGPLGRPPEVVAYNGEPECLQEVRKALHRFIVDEHIDFADIAVLTPRGRNTTQLTDDAPMGNFKLSPFPSSDRGVVQATSIFLFKGLEKRIIILAEIDDHITHNADVLMYVGCSRARTHLMILHDVNAPVDLIERLASKGARNEI
jgi:hypothetical protein